MFKILSYLNPLFLQCDFHHVNQRITNLPKKANEIPSAAMKQFRLSQAKIWPLIYRQWKFFYTDLKNCLIFSNFNFCRTAHPRRKNILDLSLMTFKCHHLRLGKHFALRVIKRVGQNQHAPQYQKCTTFVLICGHYAQDPYFRQG